MARIPVSAPDLSGNEEAYVLEALRSSWISSTGAFVDRFEADFAVTCDAKYALTVCNGTCALHLAMLALGVRPGDEVIVPALTYVATANAVRYVGAKPVFVDVDPATWCIDPNLIEAAITERTKAIVPVHLYGCPAEMGEINRIAAIHGLVVVEDAAEAHGATYRGRPVGGLGRIGVFSFYGNKVLTSGEGGAIVVNDETLAMRIRTLRGQGVDPTRRYFHPVIGYNFRLTNIASAILCAQLERIDAMIDRRRQIVARYQQRLHGIFVSQTIPSNVEPSPWMATFCAKDRTHRDRLMQLLDASGVETRPAFHPIPLLPPYRDDERSYPVSEKIGFTGICLPTYVGLTDDQVDKICDVMIHHC